MMTKEQARALGALQHLMYSTRNDLDDADSSGVYQAEIELEGFIRNQPVPEGYVLVPMEPTEDMSDAGYEAYGKGHFTPAILDCYRAMIAAAQKPKFQYYYRTNQRNASKASDTDCVCWHDEGTGPYKDQRHDDPTPLVIWRTKPGADDNRGEK